MGLMGLMVCDAGTTAPGLVRRSHANTLLRALTCTIARKPAIPCLGGAAHARISEPTCAIAGPRQCEGCANGQEALTPPHTTCPMPLCCRDQHEVVAAVRPGLPGHGLFAPLGPGLVALRRRWGRRAPRRPPRPGAPRGPRRSRKASSGAAPTRCSSSPPLQPTAHAESTSRRHEPGTPTGVMPPYSMPDASTARSCGQKLALRTSRRFFTTWFTSAFVVARTTQAAIRSSPARLPATRMQFDDRAKSMPNSCVMVSVSANRGSISTTRADEAVATPRSASAASAAATGSARRSRCSKAGAGSSEPTPGMMMSLMRPA